MLVFWKILRTYSRNEPLYKNNKKGQLIFTASQSVGANVYSSEWLIFLYRRIKFINSFSGTAKS